MADFDPAAAITSESQAQGLDPSLPLAIAQQGEGFGRFSSPDAVNPKTGARGVMQLMPGTASDMNVNAADPADNIRGGVRYIKHLSDMFNGDPSLVAAAYNAGPGAVQKAGGVPPFAETQGYVQRVTGALGPGATISKADQDAANAAYSGGVTKVTPGQGGSVYDPATGTAYTPDQAHPGQFLSPTGEPFQIASPSEIAAASDAYNKAKGIAPTVAPGTQDNLTQQALGGIVKSGAGLAHMLTSGFNPGLDQTLPAQAAWLAAAAPGVAKALASGTNWLMQPPATVPGQAARTVGEMAPGVLFGPGGETGALGQLATRVGQNVLAPAAGSLAGREGMAALSGTPQQQELAAAGGGILGAFATLGPQALTAMASHVAQPFMAAVSPAIAERAAGSKLANLATDFPQARSALETFRPPVPNFPATSGEASGDLGLLNAQRIASRKGGFAQEATPDLRTAQASAINAVPASIAPEGLTAALSSRIKAHIDAFDNTAEQAANSVGGQTTPEDSGAAVRAAIKSGEDASDANVRGLYKAVFPEGGVTFNNAGLKTGAAALQSSRPITAQPLSGEPAAIFDTIANLPASMDGEALLALKQRVNAAMSGELRSSGTTPTYGLLTQLRGVVSDAIAGRIAQEAETNPTALQRVEGWERGQQPTSAAQVNRGAGQPLAGGDQAVSPGAGGAALPPGGGPPSAQGVPGLQSQISDALTPVTQDRQVVGYTTPEGRIISAAQARTWTPTQAPVETPAAPAWDAAVSARQTAADQAYAQHAQTFDEGPVARVLKTSSGYRNGSFAMPDGTVAGAFFKPGAGGYDAMQSALKASPDAIAPLSDYAAMTLRREAMDPTGSTIDPTKFARWQSKYADSLRALPQDVRDGFANAAAASRSVQEQSAGAVGKLLNADPADVPKALGQIMGSAGAANELGRIADIARSDPAAWSGLRRGVLDYVTGRFTSNNFAGTSDEPLLRADQFKTFMRQNQDTLAKVFTPEEMDRLNGMTQALRITGLSESATKIGAGSNTAQNLYGGGLPAHGAVPTLFSFIAGGVLGHLSGLPHAQEAGEVLAPILLALRDRGVNRINDLVQRGIMDPAVYQRLTASVKGPLSPNSGAGLGLLRALAAPTLAANSNKPQPQSALAGAR
jgi:hypothetical protein